MMSICSTCGSVFTHTELVNRRVQTVQRSFAAIIATLVQPNVEPQAFNANPQVRPETSDHCCDPPTVITKYPNRWSLALFTVGKSPTVVTQQ